MFMKISAVCLGALLLLSIPVFADEGILDIPADRFISPAVDDDTHELPYIRNWQFYPLTTHWRFHSGDNQGWADPAFDDATWTTLDSAGTLLRGAVRSAIGWKGIGWFRLHLRLHPNHYGQSLALMLTQRGASAIYLDGELIRSIGRVGDSRETEQCVRLDLGWPEIIPVHFGDGREHVIAVRYSSIWQRDHSKWLPSPETSIPGFVVRLVESQAGADYSIGNARGITIHQMLFAVPLAFAVLHFFMFLFYRELRGNLYYALFAASMSLLMYAPFEAGKATDPDTHWYWAQLSEAASILTLLFSIRFLHHELLGRSPRFYGWFAAVCLLALVFCWAIPLHAIYIFYAVALFPEVGRVTFIGVRNRVTGARIIALGWMLFIAGCGYQLLKELEILSAARIFFPYLYGTIALLAAMSIHLARNFSRTNRDLAAKLVEVKRLSEQTLAQERQARKEELVRKELEAENARKSAELEEARRRQKLMDELEETNLELRETQSQLVESAKMAALGNLVAGVTHEINSPVGAMTSMLDTVRRGVKRLREKLVSGHGSLYESDSTIRRSIDAIADSNRVMSEAAGRIAGIVRNLRSFARLDEAEYQAASLEEGLDSTLAVMQSEIPDGISVVKEYGNISPIFCSPGQLNQVFMHLIRNAVQAMDSAGQLTISTSQDDEKAYVRIRDTGGGIPREQLKHIFDFRFRARDSRVKMGFGLVANYNVIQAHEGDMHIDSNEGEGTEVTIVLPRSTEGMGKGSPGDV